jgi:pilus assembly protein Flp/PilA
MEFTMKNLIAKTARFIRDEDGITAIEYALLGSLIALAIMAAVSKLATSISTAFDTIGDSI